MKYAVLAVAAIAAVSFFAMSEMSYDETDALFENFVQEYKRSYFSQDEYNLRKENFRAFLKLVDERNAVDTAEHGITKFADWSQAEFEAILTAKSDVAVLPEHDEPYEYRDIDHKSETTPVKDQGACGSCWAFSAVEAVETQHFHYTGQLVDMSEQQLVDCDTYHYGCNGGWMYKAIEYMEKQGQWSLESEYPYTARDGTCQSRTGSVNLKVLKNRRSSGTSKLASELVKDSPSVAVDAGTWSSYRSGVLTNCGKRTNHGVQAVGMDNNGNWILRNSWGRRWGDAGYITLAAGNTCAVASDISTPY